MSFFSSPIAASVFFFSVRPSRHFASSSTFGAAPGMSS